MKVPAPAGITKKKKRERLDDLATMRNIKVDLDMNMMDCMFDVSPGGILSSILFCAFRHSKIGTSQNFHTGIHHIQHTYTANT